MPFFCVLIEGSNLCIPGDQGEPPIVGFFASRVVWAADRRSAEEKALRAIRDVWDHGDYANRPTSGQLELAVSETKLSSFRRWLGAPNSGHTFFPAEQPGEDHPALATD